MAIRWLAIGPSRPGIDDSKYASHATTAECDRRNPGTRTFECQKPLGTLVDARSYDGCGSGSDGHLERRTQSPPAYMYLLQFSPHSFCFKVSFFYSPLD